MAGAKWVRLFAELFPVAILLAACSSDDGGDGTTAATG
jgi:hypothetical protein